MPALVAEHLDYQVRGAVDHLRLAGEVGRAIDEAAELDAARHSVEVAAAGRLDLGDDVERHPARRRLAFRHAEVAADLADIGELAVPKRHLPGDEHQVGGNHVRQVVRRRRGGRGQLDIQLGEAGLDRSGHGLRS